LSRILAIGLATAAVLALLVLGYSLTRENAEPPSPPPPVVAVPADTPVAPPPPPLIEAPPAPKAAEIVEPDEADQIAEDAAAVGMTAPEPDPSVDETPEASAPN
jgi:outer membrane biosynthesis protein TonB